MFCTVQVEDGFACELNEWKQCFVEESIQAVGSQPGCIYEDCRCSRSLFGNFQGVIGILVQCVHESVKIYDLI